MRSSDIKPVIEDFRLLVYIVMVGIEVASSLPLAKGRLPIK